MKGYLNSNKLNYLFFHLNQGFNFLDFHENIIFIKDEETIGKVSNKIIFHLSHKILDKNSIVWIDNLPVLFPVIGGTFYEIENNNLVFNHDLLKSAFYLLSGYQEYKSDEKDFLNRYPYEVSIQKFTETINKPLVNYYFKIIKEGIHKWSFNKKIKIVDKKLFKNFGFILSHDIDRIDFYDKYYVGYKIKQFLGLSPDNGSKTETFRKLLTGTKQFLRGKKRRNPDWNFKFLTDTENSHGIKSIFYLLPKDQKHIDAYYDLNEPRVKQLLNYLKNEGCEIGMHGTIRSASDHNQSLEMKTQLEKIIGEKVSGIRQHRLTFFMPETFLVQKRAGFTYDTTLGFAAHEGFRNSYCLPFKPYDFENDQMINIWEFPLNVMDITLFHYRELSFNKATGSIKHLIEEIKKFNGLFTLLWHNGYVDETGFKGLTNFYLETLPKIIQQNPDCVTGKELVKIIESK